MSTFSHQQRIDCIQRELKFREHVYERRVAAGKMTVNKARYELECMRDILAVLVGLEAADRLI